MMRRWVVAGLVLLLCGMVTTASAKKKKDPPASKLFCHAQYAYVETVDGDVLNPNVLPEDREAANQLIDQIQTWKRYIIVYNPGEADLAFVVRTGRLASAQLRGNVGTGGPYPGGGGPGGASPGGRNPGAATQNPQDPTGAGEYPQGRGVSTGVGVGAEVGPPDDLLQVYTSGGRDDPHMMLWERSQKDGLMRSQPLFQNLRDAVEETCRDMDDGKSGPDGGD
jgi:hypothetical protein